MAYHLGGIGPHLVLLAIILLFVHWAARKIRGKPMKRFRDWLTSWVAGPELYAFGVLLDWMYRDEPRELINRFFGIFLEYLGVLILITKIITSIVLRFRRRVPVSSPQAGPPLGPPLS